MALVSKTQIANLALSNLHEKGVIANVDTESSNEAKTARLWYDPARRHALSDYDYDFARKRQALSLHAQAATDDWTYRYSYPSDCIMPRRIEHPSGRKQNPIPFEVEQATNGSLTILTDAEDAVLIYTKDESSTTLYSPHFVLAFSYLLAHYMAGALTGKKSLKDDMMAQYSFISGTGVALWANATAVGTEAPPDTDWIRER